MDVTATDVPDLISNGIQSYFIEGIFWNCSNLKNANGSISNWNVSNITNMNFMFYNDSSFNQPLNNWDVSNVINMSGMFANAINFNQPLNDWNTANVQNTSSMFWGATSFNQPLNSWDVSNVINMLGMFAHASIFNRTLNEWNTSKVTNMEYMFYDAFAFNQNLGGWKLNSLTSADSMLNNAGLNCNNYDSTLIGWAANDNAPDGLSFGASGLGYDTPAQTAHNTLTVDKGWIITDAGLSAGCSLTLPITLVPGSFNATVQSSYVLLSWGTSTEINNKGFDIQRSIDGKNWTNIGYVNSKATGGNSIKIIYYNFTDNAPSTGINYYRFKQTNLDGNYEYSDVKKVDIGNTSNIYVYPNPAQDKVTVTGVQSGDVLRVFNSVGETMYITTASNTEAEINLGNNTAGVYFVTIIRNNNILQKIKLIKK